jgi:hypothetical protein
VLAALQVPLHLLLHCLLVSALAALQGGDQYSLPLLLLLLTWAQMQVPDQVLLLLLLLLAPLQSHLLKSPPYSVHPQHSANCQTLRAVVQQPGQTPAAAALPDAPYQRSPW